MDLIIIGLAGFIGGLLNAVAGGGSFFTLTALIYIGVPPIIANATGTAALLPGYLASAWRFRRDIELPSGLSFLSISIISILGGALGAIILLLTDEQLFASLVPWLILFATVAFVIGPWLLKQKKTKASELETSKNKRYITSLVLLMVCIYGGYFNGGLGIILLAALGLLGQTNLHGMNGIKNVISALLTSVAVIVYILGGTIEVEHLLLLSVMAILGGYFGAVFAYKIPQKMLRGFIVLVGLILFVGFIIP